MVRGGRLTPGQKRQIQGLDSNSFYQFYFWKYNYRPTAVQANKNIAQLMLIILLFSLKESQPRQFVFRGKNILSVRPGLYDVINGHGGYCRHLVATNRIATEPCVIRATPLSVYHG